MSDEKKDAKDPTPKDERPPRTRQQEDELKALKARVEELENMTPPVIQEYPKWVTTTSGEKFIVNDEATEKAVLAGSAPIPKFPEGASADYKPIVPSVQTPEPPSTEEEAESEPAKAKSKKRE